ncbi:MAG: complex I NDUFA9 subunit family protein [Xanthomonadales bacterium]|nr:complex I NDUFA9 subunit family protein [Xanthomonadales bacterium]
MGKIVILGGTGFVGRGLVDRLQAEGHSVTVLSRNRERQRQLLVYPRVRVVSARVYDPAELAAHLRGADVAINLVGILNASGRSARGFERAHVTLTRTLLQACREAGVTRLVQMSALRAGQGDSHYLQTRGQAETLVRDSDLDWTLFQPSVIFGPGDGLFCRFASLLKLTPVLPLARAHARFAPVYVHDVAAAMSRSIDRPEALQRIYPLGGPVQATLAELVRYTAQVLGLRRVIVPIPDLLARLQGLAFDFLPVPLKLFSTDNYRSLLLDSLPERDGLAELGIRATPFADVVPSYLGHGRQSELDDYRSEAGR